MLVFNFEYYPATIPVVVSLCIHSSDSTFQFRWKKQNKLFLVQDGNLRALVAGRSLFRLPLSGAITYLLTSDTAVLCQSSTLLSNVFSFLLPTLNYSNPFTGIGYCIWFGLNFAADVFTDEILGGREREGEARGCEIVLACVCVCVFVDSGEGDG